jgi:hypothetical protein
MTDLTPDQIAEREAARTRTGEFGERAHTDPELALGNAYGDVSTPLTVKVRLEQWALGDHVITVGSAEFDARAILDAEPLSGLESLRDNEDTDWVFDTARRLGIADQHDGPFTVELPDDFEDYITHRENNGMTDAYPTAAEGIAVLVMEKRQEVLAEAQRLLDIAGEHGTIEKPNDELVAGDVLVQGASRVNVTENPSPSSAMPGFMAVETDFGVLYLDPEQTSFVEVL